jgi:hypothetical protein
MTRRLAVLFLAVTAAAAVGLADIAWACSCLRYNSAAEQLARSDAVFRGRVVRTERLGPGRAATTFVVVERLKGRLGQRVRVAHGTETGGACGVIFPRGQMAEVIAHRGGRGGWQTSSCSMPQHPWAEFRRAARRG